MKHTVFRQFFRDFCSAAIYPAVFLLSLALLVLLSASCSREDEGHGGKVGSGDYITFTATGGTPSAITKSSTGSSSENEVEQTYTIYYDFEKGENVDAPAERFSDADGLSESSDTKFRGEVFTVGTGKYERIDWVDGDLITIAETYNSRKQFGDYVVSVKSGATPSITGSSVASLTPKAGSTPIQWVLNGSSDYRHDFLAIYPAVPSGATIKHMDVGYIEIRDIPYSVFPSEQECTLSTRSISNERWYAPDMQYAYMTAYSKYTSTTPPSGGLSSPLLFTPGFNAVEVKLVKPQSLPASTTVKLVSAELLHGTGGATSAFSPGGNIAFNNPNKCEISVMGTHNTRHSLLPSGSSISIFEVLSVQPGSGSNKITMTFSDGSSVVTPELDANVPTSFTFLAHPLPQKQLRLVLTLDIDGVIERRSIDLQTQSGSNKTWITVPIYQKLTISNVAQTWDDEEVTPSTPFTILTTKDNTNITINNINNLTFKYSIGGGALQTSNATPTITISVPKAGQKVRLYQESATALGRQYTFSQIIGFDQPCHVYGNIMSLCSPQTSFATATAIPNSYQFSYLFEGNANLRFHPTRKLLLPATTLAEECYIYMFSDCTGLKSIPPNFLPATTLARRCYDCIFSGCTNLTSVPADLLPATTLAYGCYSRIFIDCTGLTSIPKDLLPATTLAEECYYAMFAGCTGLTSIPADLLPATTLAARCYSAMFEGCTGLTFIPADLLPTTTLAPYCYGMMFRECTGLTSLPDGFTLPATTLAEGCYQYMFENCLGLTSIPANLLPATTLAPRCYYQMFYGCSSLTKSPNLPATEAQTECYYQMFYDCSNLNEVYCNLTTNMDYRAGYSDPSLAYHSTYNWLEGVAATGTFYANPSALAGATTSGPTNTTWHIDSPNGIPDGWLETASHFTEKSFSVSATQKVTFSPGNLQAVITQAGSADGARWQFADRQFQFPARTNGGSYNANVGTTVDLFMHPENNTAGNHKYGIPLGELPPLYSPTTTNFADWGKTLSIYKNSSTSATAYPPNTFRTLTDQEWSYLLSRESGARVGGTTDACYSLININVGGTTGTVFGMLLYPDGFTWDSATMGSAPAYVNSTTPTTVPYTLAQFNAMESAGAVFLPAAGCCYYDGTFSSDGSSGYYWSASLSNANNAYYLFFTSHSMSMSASILISNRFTGFSVRLVKDIDDFTVSSAGQKVKFSPGNLQAVIAAGHDDSAEGARWQFADKQYSYPSRANNDPYSAAAGTTVDLFMHPESNATTATYRFGIPVSNLYNPPTYNFADWGSDIDKIYESSTSSTYYTAGTYRTLKQEEWDYLLNQRESGATVGNTSNARYSLICLKVNGTFVNGMLIYPDGFTWTSAMGTAPLVNSPASYYPTDYEYTLAEFAAMESAGVVFLPAAGYCSPGANIIPRVNSNGYYWSTSVVSSNSSSAYGLRFGSGRVFASFEYSDYARKDGFSVRLVKNKN